MLRRRLKGHIKRHALAALDLVDRLLDGSSAARDVAEPHDAPQQAQPAPQQVPPQEAQPVAQEPEPAPQEAQPPALEDDTAGSPLTMAAVQELFDDMVRPALQSDGGDITLIKVEGDRVFVRLVGACSSCPSSVMTMKMGIERLLVEEFPQMRELVQVDSQF